MKCLRGGEWIFPFSVPEAWDDRRAELGPARQAVAALCRQDAVSGAETFCRSKWAGLENGDRSVRSEDAASGTDREKNYTTANRVDKGF